MRTLAVSILMGTLFGASAVASAQDRMKAGLWEMTMKSDTLMKSMPKLSAEQMEQMKKMGVNMPQMQGGAMIHKMCVTKEMAERDFAPGTEQRESGCAAKNFKRSGSTYSVDIVCDGPTLKGTGSSKGTFSGEGSFNSVYDFKGTAKGQPIEQHHESSGKWLGADCGNVRPMAGMMRQK